MDVLFKANHLFILKKEVFNLINTLIIRKVFYVRRINIHHLNLMKMLIKLLILSRSKKEKMNKHSLIENNHKRVKNKIAINILHKITQNKIFQK